MKHRHDEQQPRLFDAVTVYGDGPAAPSTVGEPEAEYRPGFKKVKRLGWVPEDWDVKPIRKLVAPIKTGVSVNGSDRPAKEDEPGVLKVSAVTEGVFKPEENKVVDAVDRSRCSRSVQGGTILISRANTAALVAASAYVEKDYPNLYLPDKLWQVEARNHGIASTRWLAYVLASPRSRSVFSAAATGSSASMKNISQSSFLAVRTAVPPLPEQRKIARILGTWDRALAQLDALIAAKEQRLKELMQRLLTGEERLPEFNQEWKQTRLGEVVTYLKRGVTPQYARSVGGQYLVLNQKALRWRGIAEADLKYYDPELVSDVRKAALIRQGDVAVNSTGDITIGRAIYFDQEPQWLLADSHITIVRTRKSLLDPRFLVAHIATPRSQYQVYSLINGSTGQMELPPTGLAMYRLSLPPIEEQRKIADIVDIIQEEIDLLCRERDALAEQKKGLMQRLLTGEVRVTPDPEDYEHPNS